MDLTADNDKNEVIGPLKHLLSLDLERIPLFVSVSNDVEKPRKPWKQVKRVRFSDEIKEGELFHTIDETGGFDLSEIRDIEGSKHLHIDSGGIPLHQTDLVSNKNSATGDICINSDDEGIEQTDVFLSATERSKFLQENILSDCNIVNSEELLLTSPFADFNSSDTDFKTNENSDCSDLIEQTRHMTISLSPCTGYELDQTCNSLNNDISSKEEDTSLQNEASLSYEGMESHNPLFESGSKNELLQDRFKKNLSVSKQSCSLNSVLNQEKFKATSAVELRSAVYSAWFQLKTDEKKTKQHIEDSNSKKITNKPEKFSTSDAFASWRKSKLKAMKIKEKKDGKFLMTSATFGTSVKIEDENEVAFRSWKKKKDKVLKQQFMKSHQKELERRRDFLMNESIKKNDSESAYFAWKVHKSQIIKKEKKKKDWMLQNEKEKLLKKMERSEEALEVYYLWLKNKHTAKKRDFNFCKHKPAWIPPGKN